MVVCSDNWLAHCINCNEVLTEDYRQPELPCPHCGSTARAFFAELRDTLEALVALKMKGYRGEMSHKKGLFIETSNSLKAQRSRGGAIAEVIQVVDKDHNPPWYTETVTMRDTGEIIHHCSEPLDQHKGHGADKS